MNIYKRIIEKWLTDALGFVDFVELPNNVIVTYHGSYGDVDRYIGTDYQDIIMRRFLPGMYLHGDAYFNDEEKEEIRKLYQRLTTK